MQNQGFIPKGKDEKNMNENQNVYDYYGKNYFNPWFREFQNKKEKTNDGKNEINNQESPNNQQTNNQMGYNNPQQWPQFDPWGIGYGGQGYGYGWPPFGFHQNDGGFGYGHNQPQNQPAPPQNQSPQQGEGEGGFYDMPFYDPYFGFNYQFDQNQGDKKP